MTAIMKLSVKELLAALLLLIIGAGPASAQSCSVSLTGPNFGVVDLTANTVYDTQQSYTISCTGGTAGQTLRLCPNLGAGSGGANGSNAPRLLADGANTLGYNLYTNSTRTSVWGSYAGGGNPPEHLITLDGNGDGSTSGTMYASLFSGQQTAPTGNYASTFSGAPNASLSWAVDTGQTCPAIGASNATAFSFTVSASYVPTCSVAGGTMDFGNIISLSSPIDATAGVSATCSAGTPYTVAMGDGLASTGSMQRRMSHGADRMTYGLYKDVSRSSAWGSAGANRSSATGSGNAQPFTVYGRIPSQVTPPAGTYTDTVVVTVSY